MKRLLPILILSLFALQCRSKYTTVLFLDPLERNREGFVDTTTYQIIGEATGFDPLLSAENLTASVPAEIKGDFDQQNLTAFQQKLKKTGKDPLPESITFREVLESQLEALPEELANTSTLDIRSYRAHVLKKKFHDQACNQSMVRSLYRWFVIAQPTLAKEFMNWESHMKYFSSAKTPKDRETLTIPTKANLPLLTAFTSSRFPPSFFFQKRNEDRMREIAEKLEEADLGFELIQEEENDPAFFSCKTVIHIKGRNLIGNYSHLTD